MARISAWKVNRGSIFREDLAWATPCAPDGVETWDALRPYRRTFI